VGAGIEAADVRVTTADVQALAEGAVVLRRYAAAEAGLLGECIAVVARAAPFRRMTTPGGWRMSVTMTNCGEYGWVSSERGYDYVRLDPLSGLPWPVMPGAFLELARRAAGTAGFTGFEPNACLINRYETRARLSLHQDKDESDFAAPIVSVSLGVPAVFLFGGDTRKTAPARVPLEHGDVVVWGGPSRLRYHGVAPLPAAWHEYAGADRLNLTLRKAR
jgi:DNA oxidative demethylase